MDKKLPHEYNFDCDCGSCSCITKHFHIKSKKQARELGFDMTENLPRNRTMNKATSSMYYEDQGDFLRFPNICSQCEIQFDCRQNVMNHIDLIHPDDFAYSTTWVIMTTKEMTKVTI